MISYIDTEKVDAIATDITRRTARLEKLFDSLFKRLSNVPNGSKEWFGNQSEAYFGRICQDKKQYLKLVNDLKEISKELKNEAYIADTVIKKLNS